MNVHWLYYCFFAGNVVLNEALSSRVDGLQHVAFLMLSWLLTQVMSRGVTNMLACWVWFDVDY